MSRSDFEDRIVTDNTKFMKIVDLPSEYSDAMYEFIEKHIYFHPNKSSLICGLSNIWVFIALKCSESRYRGDHSVIERENEFPYAVIKREEEIPWKQILKKKQYNLLMKNGAYIVGYMLMYKWFTPDDRGYHLIDFIDTRVRGFNLASLIMKRYKEKEGYNAFPHYIIYSSAGYWYKYFCKEYFPYCDADDYVTINKFIEEYDINKKELQWQEIFNLEKQIIQTHSKTTLVSFQREPQNNKLNDKYLLQDYFYA
jgi:hypothetical protein